MSFSFSKKNIEELKSHLLEFHAIVADVPKSEQDGASKDMNDSSSEAANEDMEDLLRVRKRKSSTGRPSIWKYFEKAEDGDQYCKFCEAEGISTKYKANTSSTNMRLHLVRKHGYSDECPLPSNEGEAVTERKPSVSGVWKYFCKPTRKGKILEDEHVYCGKCLENGRKIRYKASTSTTSLRKHLLAEHKIDVEDDQRVESVISTNDEDGTRRETQNFETRAVRKYFKLEAYQSWCVICEKEGHPHKFSYKTSSTILKRHLIVTHQIDPHLESNDETFPTVSQDVRTRAQEIVEQKFGRAKSYFIRIEKDLDVVYCCFCLVKDRKKGYQGTTSETNLKLHLVKKHDVTIATNDENVGRTPQLRKTNEECSVISQELAEQAKRLSETKGLKTREYFIRDAEDDAGMKHLLCVFCLVRNVRHKYSVGTGPTNLRRHLMKEHNLDPNKSLEKVPENGSSSSEDEQMMENEEESSTPFHRILIRTPAAPHIRNTKYCRSCGNHNVSFFSNFGSIFRVNNDEDESQHFLTLGDVYTEITGVQIFPDDGMSQSICYPCEANLKTAYHFKAQAVKTEDRMTQEFSIDQPMEIPAAMVKVELDSDEEDVSVKRQKRRKSKRVDYLEEYLDIE